MKDFDKKLGQILKELRTEKKLTQPQIAERLGTTKQVISAYETGYRRMSAEQLYQYCKAIGISMDDVVSAMFDEKM